MSYTDFIANRVQYGDDSGFDPGELPDYLFDFQSFLVDWAVRKGRSAVFSECGTGKTPMQLAWADIVSRHANKPVLVITPLAVGMQTIKEATKFGVESVRSRDGKYPSTAKIVSR